MGKTLEQSIDLTLQTLEDLEKEQDMQEIMESRSPEELLWHAVIQLAFEDKDIEYFQSDTFEEHCHLLKMNHEYMKNYFLERLQDA